MQNSRITAKHFREENVTVRNGPNADRNKRPLSTKREKVRAGLRIRSAIPAVMTTCAGKGITAALTIAVLPPHWRWKFAG